MTATTDHPVVLDPVEAAIDERHARGWEADARYRDSIGQGWYADRIRANNTPERRAEARAHAAEIRNRHQLDREPDFEGIAEARAENSRYQGLDAEDPWAYDRPGMHGGAA